MGPFLEGVWGCEELGGGLKTLGGGLMTCGEGGQPTQWGSLCTGLGQGGHAHPPPPMLLLLLGGGPKLRPWVPLPAPPQ